MTVLGASQECNSGEGGLRQVNDKGEACRSKPKAGQTPDHGTSTSDHWTREQGSLWSFTAKPLGNQGLGSKSHCPESGKEKFVEVSSILPLAQIQT